MQAPRVRKPVQLLCLVQLFVDEPGKTSTVMNYLDVALNNEMYKSHEHDKL